MITITALQMGAAIRARPGTRLSRALGAGRNRPALSGEPDRPSGPTVRRIIIAKQPFGTNTLCIEEDDLTLFEIRRHRAAHRREDRALLPPTDPAGRRAIQWVFAAINSSSSSCRTMSCWMYSTANEEWAKLREPLRGELDAAEASGGRTGWATRISREIASPPAI